MIFGKDTGWKLRKFRDRLLGLGAASGRGMGTPIMKDGSLLIADDTGGTIWRVSYTGPKDQASDRATTRQGRRSGSKPHDTPRDPNGPEAECECRPHHQMTIATTHANGATTRPR
jgi:hypothetical protein